MLETICPKCRQRYPLGQDHTCPKKSFRPQPVLKPGPSILPPVAPRVERAPKGTFDRKAWQREYQRRKRQEKKDG